MKNCHKIVKIATLEPEGLPHQARRDNLLRESSRQYL